MRPTRPTTEALDTNSTTSCSSTAFSSTGEGDHASEPARDHDAARTRDRSGSTESAAARNAASARDHAPASAHGRAPVRDHELARTPALAKAQATTAAAVPAPQPARVPVADRARAYLSCLPPSVAGQGGHGAAFAAAVALVRGFSLGEGEAYPLLAEWNAHCQPPWKEADLRHKLRSASATSSRPQGYLLNDGPQESSRDLFAPAKSSSSSLPGFSAGSDAETDAERKTRLRKAWPEFKPLTHEDISAIATQRRMLPDAVDLAHRWGFLKRANVDGQLAYIVHEGRFAQARRLDGKPFTRRDGTPLKAKNLPGSEGAFLGQRWLGESVTHVLLVEGAVGLLEALAACALVNMQPAWAILAATSASSRLDREPELLARLKGRHVRLVPDGDDAGLDAAAAWLPWLQDAAASVDLFQLPPGCKDLGDLVAEADLHADTLNALFHP